VWWWWRRRRRRSDDDDDNDNDVEILFECQALIAWNNNPLLTWEHHLLCYLGNQFHVESVKLITTQAVLKQC